MKGYATKLVLVFSTICAMCVSLDSMAQSDAQLSQYWTVRNYYNPAATGTTDYVNIRAGARMQWVGIPNAPQNFIVAAESPFKIATKRIGAGLVMNQESIGLFSTTNLSAQLSYKLNLFKGILSIGIQAGFVSQNFRGTEVRLPDGEGSEGGEGGDNSGTSGGTDVGVPQTDVKGSAVDFSAGAYYEHKYFWTGLSIMHFTQPALSLRAGENDEKAYEAQIGNMYYFMAGSNIPVKNTLFELQPSLLLRSNIKFTQLDLTMRAVYNKFISFGIAYRTGDAISALIGVEFKNFFFGYSYDYSVTAISRASSGSHEIFGGYRLKLNLGEKNKNKQKSIRIM